MTCNKYETRRTRKMISSKYEVRRTNSLIVICYLGLVYSYLVIRNSYFILRTSYLKFVFWNLLVSCDLLIGI